MVGEISDRCLRCYEEQYWYGEYFLFEYINDDNVKNKKILEIGCAEAGLLKFYNSKGAECSGLELSDVRFKNAEILNKENKIHLFQANICNPSTYTQHVVSEYDLIIIRDVIEHINDKKKALINIYSILKPGLIVASHDLPELETIYPRWDIFYPAKQIQAQPIQHEWGGDHTESHYDVNILSVDEENCILAYENKELFRFLEKNKINPILCKFRDRQFWDNGIHCVTQDLYREG